jgi:hypothetical protein
MKLSTLMLSRSDNGFKMMAQSLTGHRKSGAQDPSLLPDAGLLPEEVLQEEDVAGESRDVIPKESRTLASVMTPYDDFSCHTPHAQCQLVLQVSLVSSGYKKQKRIFIPCITILLFTFSFCHYKLWYLYSGVAHQQHRR